MAGVLLIHPVHSKGAGYDFCCRSWPVSTSINMASTIYKLLSAKMSMLPSTWGDLQTVCRSDANAVLLSVPDARFITQPCLHSQSTATAAHRTKKEGAAGDMVKMNKCNRCLKRLVIASSLEHVYSAFLTCHSVKLFLNGEAGCIHGRSIHIASTPKQVGPRA